ncbi:MAG: helix-turn-helix domain-containing protein [Candidatus Pacebacteria bacterium]|nr:helix-turn-helix domain-containing protein [Candidatus Paceibacterota bacterium]
MKDSILIDGQEYVSAKQAAELLDYSADYIGQLARGGKILAKRVERAWFVNVPSLQKHKEQAELYVPVPPPLEHSESLDTIVGLDGLEYVSAKRAAEISHYSHDYVTQLAREGKIPAKQVGSRWYVGQVELVKHKEHNDALLAAVQAAASGVSIVRPDQEKKKQPAPLLSYTPDNRALFPDISAKRSEIVHPPLHEPSELPRSIVVMPPKHGFDVTRRPSMSLQVAPQMSVPAPRRTLALALVTVSAVFVLVLAYGATSNERFVAAAAASVVSLSDVLAGHAEYSRSR